MLCTCRSDRSASLHPHARVQAIHHLLSTWKEEELSFEQSEEKYPEFWQKYEELVEELDVAACFIDDDGSEVEDSMDEDSIQDLGGPESEASAAQVIHSNAL